MTQQRTKGTDQAGAQIEGGDHSLVEPIEGFKVDWEAPGLEETLTSEQLDKRIAHSMELGIRNVTDVSLGYRPAEIQEIQFEEDQLEQTSKFHSCSANRELDLEKLTYFAVSIFWRAAVKDWAKGLERIDLGTYESHIRKWLLGETGYPKNVFLSVCLAEEAEDICHILPPFRLAARPFHTFYMFLPGMEFMLFVGKSVPKDLQDHCVYSGKQNFVTVGGDMKERMRRLRAKFLLAGEGIKKIEAFYKRRKS
jgi:hypothetical protein